jgi:hypothetical protein
MTYQLLSLLGATYPYDRGNRLYLQISANAIRAFWDGVEVSDGRVVSEIRYCSSLSLYCESPLDEARELLFIGPLDGKKNLHRFSSL